MPSSLLEQIHQLDEKVKAAMNVARVLRDEKIALSKELEGLRRKCQEAQSVQQRLAEVEQRVQALSQENQTLTTEREEIRRRVESMLGSIGELDSTLPQ